ncbi:MAG: hypothetical protein COC09_09075 [Gammaproteobacteria bacterium]|nr:hypothetical protein [Gammaproteobacteria bacterium]PCH62236.1 MAG: hypothetical protein COC09_09075 [Gammaproteobacteria bacterium]
MTLLRALKIVILHMSMFTGHSVRSSDLNERLLSKQQNKEFVESSNQPPNFKLARNKNWLEIFTTASSKCINKH